MSLSDYLEDALLDHILGGGDYSRPATVYVGLTTVSIADSDTGSTITEPSGGSYARVALTNNSTNWPAASGGSKANGIAINFPTATANWGTVVDFFIADAASGGNILGYGTLASAIVVEDTDDVSFALGALVVTNG